jgi:hypothetical protein
MYASMLVCFSVHQWSCPEAHMGEEPMPVGAHKARSPDYWFASILLGIIVETLGKPPIPS